MSEQLNTVDGQDPAWLYIGYCPQGLGSRVIFRATSKYIMNIRDKVSVIVKLRGLTIHKNPDLRLKSN